MIKAIDFFCGAGGLTRGLLNVGVDVLAGVDNDDRLRDTYTHNNKPARFLHRDIRDIDIHELRRDLQIQDNDLTLYAACTPCQPFSSLNSLRGKDNRKTLLLDFGKIVRESPPDFILIENVPGLNNAFGAEVYREFLTVLRQCGIPEPSADLLDAKYFGVPQTRKRFVLLASRHGVLPLPPPFLSNEIKAEESRGQFATVRNCIEKYPSIADGKPSNDYLNHLARKLQPHHIRIVEAVPKDGGSRHDVADTSILLRCHQKNPKVHKDVFGRMAWDEPSPTLTCRCTDVYCGRFIHPEQDRGISLREAAALQTFEDEYEFFGSSFSFLASQIGNAVPVKFGEALGQVVLQAC